MHDDGHWCVFGCGGHDNMRHYWLCTTMWSIVLRIACTNTPDEPVLRIATILTAPCGLRVIALAFGSYHALKDIPVPSAELIERQCKLQLRIIDA